MNFPVELDDWIENPEVQNVDPDMYGLQPFHPLPAVGMKAMPELRSGNSRGNLETLDVLFSRYRRLLSLIAYRVLGNDEDAEDAVQNCLRAASVRAPRFDHEGAFRSWLARVLIDEAVTILVKRGSAAREPDCQRLLKLANRQRCGCFVTAATPRPRRSLP